MKSFIIKKKYIIEWKNTLKTSKNKKRKRPNIKAKASKKKFYCREAN